MVNEIFDVYDWSKGSPVIGVGWHILGEEVSCAWTLLQLIKISHPNFRSMFIEEWQKRFKEKY
ncbi:MAG: hypothetical protein M1308_17570 [Actinobacteria bacterium]|nr:hypothetical protein [Actinomycetota bacterium]